MNNWQLYHGTSSERWKKIKQSGFIHGEICFFNWLAPQGIYFVPNRPLIARRFAQRRSEKDGNCNPIVLEIKLKMQNLDRILDLTTDKGMNLFYLAYREVYKQSTINKGTRGVQYNEYFDSVSQEDKHFMDILEQTQSDDRFNWDTVAIRRLVMEHDFQLVIAAIQEGTSLNLFFSGREPVCDIVPHYSGINFRDHIEVCVTDLSLIEHNSTSPRDFINDSIEFDEEFKKIVTDINTRDLKT